jgi:protein-disulfide isomerase
MRENGFRAIGGLAQRLTSGIAKGRGASIARLRAEWTAIVGPELARITRPEALLSGRGARAGVKGAGANGAGKALRLRVAGVAALEVQHMGGQLVERVNAYFGHKMIDDIRLVQGVIAVRPAPKPTPAPDPVLVTRVAERAASVQDPDLRAALTRLGARVASRRHVMLGATLSALGAAFVARDLRAQELPREKLLEAVPGDHILGKIDAPNTLIDYASFTCPHCANFYIAVMPTLRKEWIDTGKLRLIHRHFPSDMVATRASQLTECAPPDKFFVMVELLFRKQVDWLSVGDPEVEMVKVLADQGVTPEGAQACFANDRLLDKVLADVQSGQTLGVRFTPTLFINEENYANPGTADAISAILRQVGR